MIDLLPLLPVVVEAEVEAEVEEAEEVVEVEAVGVHRHFYP
jgi:hypothetical protein